MSILRKTRWLLLGASLMIALGMRSPAATSVSQYGITWTFDRDYPVGQFVNGDYWVVGPVKITSITPRDPSPTDSTHFHGSMVNAMPNTVQGFDSRFTSVPYSAPHNVARQLPLTLPPGSSLLSAEGYATFQEPFLKSAAVLTVLAAPAPAGSFRPPYAGTDKTLRWNVSDLSYAAFKSLPRLADTPTIESVENNFGRVLIDLKSTWRNSVFKAKDNFPNYGRDISYRYAHAALQLHLNYSNAQKQKLLVGLVQHGIDIYGLAKNGMSWNADGGHNTGRKLPLYIAAKALNDPGMLEYADAKKHLIFQEDQQHFYVEQVDINTARYNGVAPFTQTMLGMAEWGGKTWTSSYTSHPERNRNTPDWEENPYRRVNGGPNTAVALMVHLMGGKAEWNWPAFFDYIDKRFYPKESPNAANATNKIYSWVKNLWGAYRNAPPQQILSITNVQVTSVTQDRATINFSTSAPAATSVQYGLTSSYGSSVTSSTNTSTAHTFTVTGLTPGSVYHYRIRASGSTGATSETSDATFTTAATVDTTAPTVTLTSPATNMAVSGIVAITADANDNIGVAGVKLYINGEVVSDDTSAPYSFEWDTQSAVDGTYTVQVQARDKAGNTASSVLRTLTVQRPSVAGPVAQWKFDEGSGLVANDAAGANQGKLVGGAAWSAGHSGSAVRFTSAGKRVEIPSFNITGNQVTLSAWINPTSSGTERRIVSKAIGTALADQYWMLELTPTGEFGFRINASGTTTRLLSPSTRRSVLNVWQHVAGTYDGATMRLYVNGDLVASVAKSGTIRTGTAPVWVGDNPVGGGRQFLGAIDDVRVYNRVLSGDELRQIFSAPEEEPSTEVYQSSAEWLNVPIESQAGVFKLSFTMTPSATGIDCVTGLSSSAASAFTDLAPAIRFAPTGVIDARNGGAYQARTQFAYAANVPYNVVMSINIAAKRYSVTVAREGETPVTIAADYVFRTEQTNVSTLSNLALVAVKGSHSVSRVLVEVAP